MSISCKPGAIEPGSVSSLIVYRGTVYASYFRPVGPPFDTNYVRRQREECGDNANPIFGAINSSDIVLAVDALTGRTKWKKVFESEGLNFMSVKRGGWGVTPVAYNGRVFAMSTLGKVRAFDPDSGRILWERNAPQYHAMVELKEKALHTYRRNGGSDSDVVGLVVADGVLLIPDYAGGTMAIDPENGDSLWYEKQIRYSSQTPSIFKYAGKEYFLVGTGAGEMKLHEPRSGRMLWKVGGLCPVLFNAICHSDSMAFVLEPSALYDSIIGERKDGRWAAYRMTPEGATRAWALPLEWKYSHSFKKDGGPAPRAMARDGIVYIQTRATDLHSDTGRHRDRDGQTSSVHR